jgi:DnaJ-class molecular chaperone
MDVNHFNGDGWITLRAEQGAETTRSEQAPPHRPHVTKCPACAGDGYQYRGNEWTAYHHCRECNGTGHDRRTDTITHHSRQAYGAPNYGLARTRTLYDVLHGIWR